MKKPLLCSVVALLIAVTCSLATATSKQPAVALMPAPIITIDISFGYHGRGCDKTKGICISIGVGFERAAVSRGNSYATLTDDGHLQMGIAKNKYELKNIMVSGIFTLDEDSEVFEDVMQKLGKRGPYKLKAGKYDVEETPTHYVVTF